MAGTTEQGFERRDRNGKGGTVTLAVVVALLVSGIGFDVDFLLQAKAHSRSDDACRVSANGGIVGFDLRTGVVRWTNVVPTGTALRIRDGHVITIGPDLQRRTIDPASGRVTSCEHVRTRPVGAFEDPAVVHPPAGVGWPARRHTLSIVLDGSVVLGRLHSRDIERRDVTTGRVLWRATLPRPVSEVDPVRVHGAFVFSQGRGAHVAVVDAATGRVRWTADEAAPGRSTHVTEALFVHEAVALPAEHLLVVEVDALDPRAG